MAELAIGSVSFFFQVFAGCIQGYELIADACHLEKDAQPLLVKFKIEEHRLLNWAKTVRLDYRDDKLVLNHMSKGLIMNILEQQQKLLHSFGRLNSRYERLYKPLLKERPDDFVVNSNYLIEDVTDAEVENSQTVQFPPAEELLKKSLDFMKKFKDVPKRLRWASWDRERMEALIVKLADFNDKMHEALDKAQMDNLLEMQTRTNYQIVLLNRQMENMVQIWQSERLAYRRHYAIEEIEDDEYDELEFGGPSTRSLTMQPLGDLARQKFVQLAIEDSHDPQDNTRGLANDIDMPYLTDNIRDTRLDFGAIESVDGGELPLNVDEGDRTEAIYNSNRVWIEWKMSEPYGHDPNGSAGNADNEADECVDPKIHARVRKLAALLKKNNRTVRFRAPHCLGYFIDSEESRFGLVFEKPVGARPTTPPTSLHALICAAASDNPNVEIPPLNERIKLMRLLSETVERLHAVDWLHKGLRSTNILFFPRANDSIDYTAPFISGFDYSRPATRDDMTEQPSDNPQADLYRHPLVQSRQNRDDASGRESFRKSFDLYALGLVLLEIAYWRPLDAILAINLADPKVTRDTLLVRDRLLVTEPKHLKHVKAFLGATVEDVVHACLEGPTAFGLDEGDDEKREIVGAALQRGFGDKVVARLGSVKGL